MMAVPNYRIYTVNNNYIVKEHYPLQELLIREIIDLGLLQETRKPLWFKWRIPGYHIYHTLAP